MPSKKASPKRSNSTYVVYKKMSKTSKKGLPLFKRLGGAYQGKWSGQAGRKACSRKHVKAGSTYKTFYLKKTGTNFFFELKGKLGKKLARPLISKIGGKTIKRTRESPVVEVVKSNIKGVVYSKSKHA